MAQKTSRTQKELHASFIPPAAKVGALLYKTDWSKTPLGPMDEWPQHVKTTVSIMLNSDTPMVTLWGKRGTLIYNDAYALFAGNKHPKIFGMDATKAWPEIADFNRVVIKRGLAGEQWSLANQKLLLGRGHASEEVWLDLKYSPIDDDKGQHIGVFVIVLETTQIVLAEQERKKAETVAETERQKLNYLFDNSPACIALLSGVKHTFTYTNEPFKQIIGNRDVIGKAFVKALPEITDSGLDKKMNTVFRSGKRFVAKEMQVNLDRTGSGELEPGFFDFVYEPIKDADGSVTDIFIHAIEVTEQVNARQRLYIVKRMFDALFDSKSSAIVLADLSGTILEAKKRL